MSKPNPQRDPLIKLIIAAAARGRAILAQQRGSANDRPQVQSSNSKPDTQYVANKLSEKEQRS